MAIAAVQETGKNFQAGSATSLAITVTNAPAAGNLLVLRSYLSNTIQTLSTVTDTRGNTWLIDYKTQTAGITQTFICSTGMDAAPLQAADTITLTWSSAIPTAIGVVDEFSGVDISSVRVDVKQAAEDTTTNRTAGTTASTTVANTLAVGAFGASINELAWVKSASWTDFPTAPYKNAANSIVIESEYRIFSSTTPVNATATGTAANSRGVCVVYKASGGRPGGTVIVSREARNRASRW